MFLFDVIMFDESFTQMIGGEVEFPAISMCDNLVTNIVLVDFFLERGEDRVETIDSAFPVMHKATFLLSYNLIPPSIRSITNCTAHDLDLFLQFFFIILLNEIYVYISSFRY